jgi:mono/diheme cytochrome c family protein
MNRKNVVSYVAFAAALGTGAALGACSEAQRGPAAQRGPVGLANAQPTVGRSARAGEGRDGPANPVPPKPIKQGNFERGRNVFRFETFGTEGFWTDVVRLPQGMAAKKVTILAALKNGVNFDSDALPADLRQEIEREVKTDLSPEKARVLNDPSVLPQLVRANAVIGMVERNGKSGVTCALCHTITDRSVFGLGDKGSIGRRIDGPTPHSLELGHLLAYAANSRALYPLLQLDQGGTAIGRVPTYRLNKDSTEEEVDAYFNDPKAWPPGTFDDTPDGIGNTVHIQPLFRQDLSAPFTTVGQVDLIEDFSNTVFTALFDQTALVSPAGRTFMHTLGGAAGDKLVGDYAQVLAATNVPTNRHYVVAKTGLPAGKVESPTGRRVDDQILYDLNSYLAGTRAPAGHPEDKDAVARGRQAFRTACTSCHNVDSSRPVDARLFPVPQIWPAYDPTVIATRAAPLTPIQNSPGIFDDKMVIVDASPRGEIRGIALPLLLDLARKPAFLHDDSVPSLGALMDPARGSTAPHPFYVADPALRSDVAAFLRSLGD